MWALLLLGLAVGCGEGSREDADGDADADVDAGADGDADADTDADADADADAGADADTDADGDPCPEPGAGLPPWDPDDFLCDIPEGYVDDGGDPANPPCDIAAGGGSDRDPTEVPDELTVVSWNVRFGIDEAAVIETLTTTPALANADFLLLQEVARRDLASDPPGIDQAEEIALALGTFFTFAVEWDRRENEGEGGEHGVAVLSRYPLENASFIRHTPLNDWWAEDNRYGGRVTLAVDARVGCSTVRLYSVHLDTRGAGDSGRAEQGAEIRADADAPGRASLQIAAGDFNTWTCNPFVADCGEAPAAEQVVEDFLDAGWADAIPDFDSYTQLGEGFFRQRLDWIFHRGGLASVSGEVLQEAAGSDHFPVVWRFSLPR